MRVKRFLVCFEAETFTDRMHVHVTMVSEILCVCAEKIMVCLKSM